MFYHRCLYTKINVEGTQIYYYLHLADVKQSICWQEKEKQKI